MMAVEGHGMPGPALQVGKGVPDRARETHPLAQARCAAPAA